MSAHIQQAAHPAIELEQIEVSIVEDSIKDKAASIDVPGTSEGLRSAEVCSICLDHISEAQEYQYLACTHKFHTDCINLWLVRSNLCPLCKQPASDNETHVP